MENKHDNLEDLFRKSLENYSVPDLQPWGEVKKLLQERKQKERKRRLGYWPYLLTAVLLLGVLFYVTLSDRSEKRKVQNVGDMKVKIQEPESEPTTGSDTPARSEQSYPMTGGITTAKVKSRKGDSGSKWKPTDSNKMISGIKMNVGKVPDRPQAEINKRIENNKTFATRRRENSNALKGSDATTGSASAISIQEKYGKSGSLLALPERHINTSSSLRLPDIASYEPPDELSDSTDRLEDYNPRPKSFPIFYTGVHIGVDHLALPRNGIQNIDFSNTGFMESPSVSLSGIVQLSPRFMIRSGLSVHWFRESLSAGVHRTIKDIVYSVKEKPGDLVSTESAREIQFDSSYHFSNRYTTLGLPILAGYTLPLGTGKISVFSGFSANFQLNQTAIVSTNYRLNSEVVKDYANGMDPDLDGYIHYERYQEYTAEFVPTKSRVKPISLLFDLRVMGRWPLGSHLDLAAEISYAQGLSPFFAEQPRINPRLTGVRIGLLYRWKKLDYKTNRKLNPQIAR